MNDNKIMRFFNKAKDYILKNKLVAIVIVILVIAVGFGYSIYNAQPKSVISNVHAKFNGYNGDGNLDYNRSEIDNSIEKIALESVGFNKKQIEKIQHSGLFSYYSEFYNNSALREKYTEAIDIVHDVSYNFDKTSELRNGETVTLTVKTSSSHSPIKEESKKFKVKGLKKIKTVSIKELLKKFPVTFFGFNHYGQIKLPYVIYDDGKKDDNYFTVSDKKSNYKNGDKVKLEVSEEGISDLKSEGKQLDSNQVEVEVKGLKEIFDISNVADALAKNDVYAKSEYQNSDWSTYTIEKQKNYIAYQTDSYNQTTTGQIYIVTVYKISKIVSQQDSFNKNTVDYNYYGYSYYVNSDNSLDLETANKVHGSSTQDYENICANLEIDGYKEYKGTDSN